MAERRRIGVMGGTFDPIHLGHLVAAAEVKYRLALDEMYFVPTGQPWQKQDRDVTSAEHRYVMTVLGTDRTGFRVSRVDIDRGGPTFTVDTLRDLHAALDPADLFFIVGADALAGVDTWREPEQVRDLAHLVGVSRPGHEMLGQDVDERATILTIPAIEVSSTICRERVAAGAPIDSLVPAPVVEYIHKHALYR
jgi:nicotinate-nucleotide adenylyltransferase